MTMPKVWSSVALATMSAAMLPDAPGLFSTTMGWPSALDNGSANARAAMSGLVPPGKPTTILTGLLGQLSSAFLLGFWPQAHENDAQAAIKIIAFMNEWTNGIGTILSSFSGL
jgi:hypothetical protein